MANDNLFLSSKMVFKATLIVFFYLAFLFLNAETIKLNFAIISVMQEILTIPIIIAELILCYFAFYYFRKSNYSLSTYGFYSIVILLIINVFIWGSFLFS
jgi:hypothetical protein